MNIASRFQAQPEGAPLVQFHLDGENISTRAGVSLAAALLADSGAPTRQTASGNGRAAFCMMGVCFECLVEVNGTPNTQACMTIVQEGMQVKRQLGLRGLNGGKDA